MKIKDGYILSTVAGKNIVVSVGADTDFSGMLTLNDTGLFFWKILEKGTTREEMISSILEEYNIDEKTVSEDVDVFLKKLRDKGILED